MNKGQSDPDSRLLQDLKKGDKAYSWRAIHSKSYYTTNVNHPPLAKRELLKICDEELYAVC